jgi:hypothetical protein
MTSNFAPRKSWKQPMTGNIAPRKWTWPATSNMQLPAGGIRRNRGHAEYIGICQTAGPAISAGEGVLEKVAADVVAAVGGRRI